MCLERADLLTLFCGVLLWVCHFPIGILGQVWYLIVSIPDLCTLTYFKRPFKKVLKKNGSLMKVESIAECSLRAFCNTFDLH